jgi:hypothetical protein
VKEGLGDTIEEMMISVKKLKRLLRFLLTLLLFAGLTTT